MADPSDVLSPACAQTDLRRAMASQASQRAKQEGGHLMTAAVSQAAGRVPAATHWLTLPTFLLYCLSPKQSKLSSRPSSPPPTHACLLDARFMQPCCTADAAARGAAARGSLRRGANPAVPARRRALPADGAARHRAAQQCAGTGTRCAAAWRSGRGAPVHNAAPHSSQGAAGTRGWRLGMGCARCCPQLGSSACRGRYASLLHICPQFPG